jgi:hypothetical protein
VGPGPHVSRCAFVIRTRGRRASPKVSRLLAAAGCQPPAKSKRAHATRALRSPKEGDPKQQPQNLAIEAAPSHHRFLTSWSPPPLKGRERERAMGGSPSRSRRSSSFPQQLQYGGYYDQGAQSSGYYAAPYQAAPPPAPRPRLDRRYSRIADDYNSVEQVRFAAVGCNCSSSARLNVSRVWISDLSYRRSTELIRSVWSLNCSSSLGFAWISKAIVNQPAIIRSCQWRLR